MKKKAKTKKEISLSMLKLELMRQRTKVDLFSEKIRHTIKERDLQAQALTYAAGQIAALKAENALLKKEPSKLNAEKLEVVMTALSDLTDQYWEDYVEPEPEPVPDVAAVRRADMERQKNLWKEPLKGGNVS